MERLMKKTLLLWLLLSGVSMAQVPTAQLWLTWTAPGDDSTFGQATGYDLRVASDTTLFVAEWDSCRPIEAVPTPSFAGAKDSVCITIPVNTPMYYCIKSFDEVFNMSGPSNYYYVFYPLDLTPPCVVNDLSGRTFR
jgi:hypothetical protein